MARTKHPEHKHPQSWCPACRWDRMSPDEQAAYRDVKAKLARERWRRKHPARAALRDILLEGAVPQTCDRCGGTDDTAAIVDYDEIGITGWRCRACWRTARDEWRAANRNSAADPDQDAR